MQTKETGMKIKAKRFSKGIVSWPEDERPREAGAWGQQELGVKPSYFNSKLLEFDDSMRNLFKKTRFDTVKDK
jgi:hypothetical protein